MKTNSCGHLNYAWMSFSDAYGINKSFSVNMEKFSCILRRKPVPDLRKALLKQVLDWLPARGCSITSHGERHGTINLGVTDTAREIPQNKISAPQLHRNSSETVFSQSHRWWHENRQQEPGWFSEQSWGWLWKHRYHQGWAQQSNRELSCFLQVHVKLSTSQTPGTVHMSISHAVQEGSLIP